MMQEDYTVSGSKLSEFTSREPPTADERSGSEGGDAQTGLKVRVVSLHVYVHVSLKQKQRVFTAFAIFAFHLNYMASWEATSALVACEYTFDPTMVLELIQSQQHCRIPV